MRNLYLFLVKNYAFILFLVLEVICGLLLIKNNQYQRATVLNSASNISGGLYQRTNNFSQYLDLTETNEKLMAENAALRKRLLESYYVLTTDSTEVFDSLYEQRYDYIQAKVINNSFIRRSNYLTLDRGTDAGIRRNMGLIGPDGLVGILRNVGDKFSSARSLLHKDIKISSLIARNGVIGSLIWQGYDHRYAMLNDIPAHVEIEVGDEVITSGFSSIFPKGIPIGKVTKVEKNKGDNFQEIEVSLATKFESLDYVYVIRDFMKNDVKFVEGEDQ
jgi:rod shape-determining protein MreC